jgi:transcriptional regulator with XRE-family HTH domain
VAFLLYFLSLVRHDRQLSLHQLARASNIHRLTIARYERGERPKSPTSIQRLASALTVSPDVLSADAIVVYRDGRIEVAR